MGTVSSERVGASAPCKHGASWRGRLGASENETWVLIFGVRAGWVQQLAGGWAVDSRDEGGVDGPSLNLSGLRGRLVLGFGAALL